MYSIMVSCWKDSGDICYICFSVHSGFSAEHGCEVQRVQSMCQVLVNSATLHTAFNYEKSREGYALLLLPLMNLQTTDRRILFTKVSAAFQSTVAGWCAACAQGQADLPMRDPSLDVWW